MVAKVKDLEGQLKLAAEKEKKASEKDQVLARKFEDLQRQRTFDRDIPQVKL